MSRPLCARSAVRLAALAVALGLGGCAADDLELNGGVFDALGMNTSVKKTEPKLAARAPLVVPPGLERLPQPGVPADSQSTDLAALINDPDRKAQVSRADLERQQAAYCSKNYDLAKAHGDNNADLAEGPLGKCRGSVLGAIQQWNAPEQVEVEKQ